MKSLKFVIILFFLVDLLCAGINLNTATEKELVQAPGITPQIAHAILVYREKYRDFRHVDEIYNACWEVGLPITMDYVRLIQEKARIYAITPENWSKGLADTYFDLILPSIIHFVDGDYVIKLHDGGYIVVVNNSVTTKQARNISRKIKGRGLFGLAKPVIDWLVITKPDIDARELGYDCKIERVYVPREFRGRSGRWQRAERTYVVKDIINVDLLQSFACNMVIKPVEDKLSVEIWYDKKRVVLSPYDGELVFREVEKVVSQSGKKQKVKELVKEVVRLPGVIYNPLSTVAFDSDLVYYFTNQPPEIKVPRRSELALEERRRLLEELKAEMIDELYEEIESAGRY